MLETITVDDPRSKTTAGQPSFNNKVQAKTVETKPTA